jgi:hypothetical protein
MKTKAEIVLDWLPRYTGRPLDQFGKYVLLTNFAHYVELFAARYGVEILGRDRPMQSATAQNITVLNFGMGSAMAATVMDLLSAVLWKRSAGSRPGPYKPATRSTMRRADGALEPSSNVRSASTSARVRSSASDTGVISSTIDPSVTP